ncbi:MAG: alkaline phosphatase family protein [Candidatus Krumholzibacteria bacterium]|nr:alkaline phosphatase family protein [Candidatus Krumholzibacteria bacterium]
MRSRAAALLAAIAVVASSCGKPAREVSAEARAPMLLLAVDGLEWRVMAPLLEAGRMPVVASLMGRGTYGYLATMEPTYSAVIWTTIATGKRPAQHGIEHFIYEETIGGKKEHRYYTSGHRETKAFWNILSDYSLDVDCLGWWITYPAEPINGVMVSQTNTTGVLRDPQRALWKGTLLEGVEGQVYPPERQNEVMALLDEVDSSLDELTREIFGEFPNPMDDFGRLMWDQTLWAFRADAVYLRTARALLDEGMPFDLMAVYVGGPDVTGHRFWRYAHPGDFYNPPAPEQIENFGRVIDDYYAYVDRAIGELIDAAPEGTAVVIVSDHGMHTVNPKEEFRVDNPPDERNSGNHMDAPPGVFIAAGPNILDATPGSDTPVQHVVPDSLPRVGGVLDVLPTLLALKGIPLAEDMSGTPLAAVIDPALLARARTLPRVKTYDDRAWQGARRERIREAVNQNERLEQLRSLGYIR